MNTNIIAPKIEPEAYAKLYPVISPASFTTSAGLKPIVNQLCSGSTIGIPKKLNPSEP